MATLNNHSGGSNPLSNQVGTLVDVSEYPVFCGGKATMLTIQERGAKALNPRTMKWHTINPKAKYSIRKVDNTEYLWELLADTDLRAEAEAKGLIL